MTKKTLMALLVATMMGATTLIAQDVMIEEDFSLMTAGSEAYPDGTNIAGPDYYIDSAYTHLPGWTASHAYQAGGTCCLNNPTSAFISTPEMEMTGMVHLSLKARMKNTSPNQTMMYVLMATNPYEPVLIQYTGCYINHDWATYEFDLDNPETEPVFIQFYCYCEWFIDDVVVTRELNFCPAPKAHEATDYTMQGFTASWKPVDIADEYMFSLYKKEFYGPEIVSEIEYFDGINHNGQWIDIMNPNYPEGWTINLDAGDKRQVVSGDCVSEPTALCMDAEGDTIILPYNGGRMMESNLYLKLLEYNPNTDDADLIFLGKMGDTWQDLGLFFADWWSYQNHGNEWFRANIIEGIQEYEQFALAYSGQGTVWALDNWDYQTTQGTFGGKSMKANLEIFHPGFKPKLLGFIASVMNSETIILARLNNGDVHMLGDADRGAEIGDSVEATSGKAVTDNNGATIAFVYDTPTAQIYTGEMDSLIGQSTNLDEVDEVIP